GVSEFGATEESANYARNLFLYRIRVYCLQNHRHPFGTRRKAGNACFSRSKIQNFDCVGSQLRPQLQIKAARSSRWKHRIRWVAPNDKHYKELWRSENRSRQAAG